MKTIRTFIAFELPAAVTQLAAALQSDLKAHKLKMRWVKPPNIHLTLKFLGEISPVITAEVVEAMRQTAQAATPLELSVQGMGVFPGMRKPRVLWIGLGGQTDALQDLHAKLEEALATLGFQSESRPFKAHLTLARIDGRMDPQMLLQGIESVSRFEPSPFQASELILFQSDLKPQGPIYTPLARVPLGRR